MAKRLRREGFAFSVPAWILLGLVVALPIVTAVYLSLTDLELTRPQSGSFVGFENYRDTVFTSEFLSSLMITLLFVVGALVIQFVLGYTLAYALAQPLRGRMVFRTGILVPLLMTPIAVGLMWRFLFNPDLGLVRWILEPFVGGGERINFLGDVWLARGVVIGIDTWMNTAFVTILLLAGMLGINDELYEAAAIDGASRWQTTFHITIPLLTPVILVVFILRYIALFRLFDIVFAVTRGGPGTSTRNLSIYAFEEAFRLLNVGRAASIAIAMAVLSIPTYWAFSRLVRPDV
jgi:multiple sugar transport system permease protein